MPSVEDQITKAIGAHGQWKFRLVDAIGKGTSEFDPNNVQVDNKCEFGIWLHQEISPVDKSNSHYRTVVALHAKFHKLAAAILREAVNGQADKARKMIAPGSDYAQLSTEMTLTLMAWKKELALSA